MGLPWEHLKISGAVASSQEASDALEVAPIAGKTIIIHSYHGEADYSKNSNCRIVWNYNHATEPEEVLWTIKGSSQIPFQLTIKPADLDNPPDGTRNLAIVNDNAEASSIYMSSHAEIEVK